MRLSSHSSRLNLSLGVISLLLVAACTPQATALPPPGTFAPQPRDVPTQAPPIWVEGSQPVTLANASRITYIGRLDAPGTSSTLFAYAFSPDNTRLVGLNNDLLIAWDLVSGQVIFTTSRGDAQFVYYASDKSEVYTVNSNGLISIYNADTGQSKTTLQGQTSFNNTLAYYADQGWLALGGQDGSVKIWDVGARQALVTIKAHNLQITGLTFSADGERLATSSDDQTVKIWDWHAKQTIAALQATAQKLAFSPDGKQLAAEEISKITLWDTTTGKLVNTLTTTTGAPSDILIYSPDGQYLTNSGIGVSAMSIWDTKTGALLNNLPGVGGDTTSAAFSPDGDLLVTSVLGGLVSLWDVTQFRAQILTHADLAVGTRQILYSDWTGDGFLMILVDATGPVQVWGIPPQPATPTPAQGT